MTHLIDVLSEEYLSGSRKRQKRISTELQKTQSELAAKAAAVDRAQSQQSTQVTPLPSAMETVYGQEIIGALHIMRSHLPGENNVPTNQSPQGEEIDSMVKFSKTMHAVGAQLMAAYQQLQQGELGSHAKKMLGIRMEVMHWFTQQQPLMFRYLQLMLEGYIWQGDKSRQKSRNKCDKAAAETVGPDQRVADYMVQQLAAMESAIAASPPNSQPGRQVAAGMVRTEYNQVRSALYYGQMELEKQQKELGTLQQQQQIEAQGQALEKGDVEVMQVRMGERQAKLTQLKRSLEELEQRLPLLAVLVCQGQSPHKSQCIW